ncbi:MAG: NAD(P)/FAD-dependent oxidoreductase [Oligoflexia bacterium]|nr:NAD(P)/FAD-dependent oxidoreductase [Oligoflexia bacterium]
MDSPKTQRFDVIIIGAGGAGMMCAIHAAKRGRSVLLLDHAKKLGGKILISGGGRCNFTNLTAGPLNYVSKNPHFCKSALSRYPAESFIDMVRDHGIAFHEKKLGQLFCDRSAQEIVDMLKAECDQAGAQFLLDCPIQSVAAIDREGARYQIETRLGSFICESLVIATGGLSIPKIGATGWGYELAQQFGLKLVPRAAALDGFVFADEEGRSLASLAGLSIDCKITCNDRVFRENILFTHSGLSGPAALQSSLHWYPGDGITIDLLPELDCFSWFLKKKKEGSRALVRNLLAELLPSRFSDWICERHFRSELPLPQVSERALEEFCHLLKAWKLSPSGTVGYSKAEVTRGGVDTDELSSKTMESKKAPGLYFIGEVVDVTGWLGGYNFQWAWASGWAAGQVA